MYNSSNIFHSHFTITHIFLSIIFLHTLTSKPSRNNMKFIKNNNINLKFLCIILICFALEKCMAHTFPDTSLHIEPKITPHHDTAIPPTHSSESPQIPKPHSPEHEHEHEHEHGGGHSASFKAAFADILKGSLRGPSLTIPHSNLETKHSALSLEQICMHTDYPDICLSTIKPLISNNFELINVLEAAIKVCSIQIKMTITKVAKHAAQNPEIANAVAECREQYNNAMDNLKRAMDVLPSRDLGTVTVMLSAVMADVSACESAFEDLKASPSSGISKTDGLVSITVSNCLSIANLIPY